MNLSVEQRVIRLEKSQRRLRAKLTKLYQTFYAAKIRRGNTYGRRLDRAMKRVATISKNLPAFIRLARLAMVMDKDGKMVMTLSRQESQLLHAMLRRQKPFAPRGK